MDETRVATGPVVGSPATTTGTPESGSEAFVTGHLNDIEFITEYFDTSISELSFARSPEDETTFVTDSGKNFVRLRTRNGDIVVDSVRSTEIDRDALEQIPNTQPSESNTTDEQVRVD